MYLKRLVIKNFRCFDETGVELIFNKGVNAIIGENNSGKSAVIDAIRIAFSSLSYKRDLFFTIGDFHVGNDGRIAQTAQFDVFLGDVPLRLIEIWNPKCTDENDGEFHIRFEKYLSPSKQPRVRSTAWGYGTEGNKLSHETLEAIEVVFLGALRDAESEMKPSRNSKLAQLLKNLTPNESDRAKLIGILTNANSVLLNEEQIRKTRDTVNENLTNIEQKFLNQQIDVGLIEPKFDSIASSLRAWVKPKWILINPSDTVYEKAKEYSRAHQSNNIHSNEKGIYFEISVLENPSGIDQELVGRITEIANNSFELYQNGLGYNNLLYMSAVLGDMALQKGGVCQNLLLVEEPEAHLHPQLQELVHRFLADTNKGDSNIQVIYTSHSPTLASKIDVENINLLYDSDHNKCCLPFSQARLKDRDKKYLQEYLDVTKSQMFFARGILFVEGISEAILLPAMAKAIDRPFEKYAVELVNVGSVAFMPFVNLFSSDRVKTRFSKVSIITDDDRCDQKDEVGEYIDRNCDFENIEDKKNSIAEKLRIGQPSNRCKELGTACSKVDIKVFMAKKTLEYELCLCGEDNIYHIIDGIKVFHKTLGTRLEEKIESLHSLQEKSACVWLFIRNRQSCKGEIAQYISQLINKQTDAKKGGECVEKEFIIPDYLKKAIYSVTEQRYNDQ